MRAHSGGGWQAKDEAAARSSTFGAIALDGPAIVPRDGAPAASIVEAEGVGRAGRRDAVYRRLLVAADLVAAVGALYLSVEVVESPNTLTPWAALLLPFVVFMSKVLGLYDRDELLLHKSTLEEVPGLFQLATLVALVTWLLERFLVTDGTLQRWQVITLWLGLVAGMVLARKLARTLAGRRTAMERCLLIGDAEAAEQIGAKLRGGGINAALVAHTDLHEAVLTNGRHTLLEAQAEELRRIVERFDVDRVIVQPQEGEATLDLVRTLKGIGLRVSLLPRILEVVGSSVEFDDLNGVTVLGVRSFKLSRSSGFIKRALDVVASGAGLILLAPVLAAIAAAVRLDSRGSALFRQTRVGRDGRPFAMLKFRTMVAGADAQKAALREANEAVGLFKIRNDPRMTRVGRFLRQSALDELPQLWNVLHGEMSLVGPRPLVVDDDRQIVGWRRHRLHLTPGMTGHWQVLGSARIPLHEMVAIDYLYVANWSLWNDLKILLRTGPYMIRRRGL